MKFILITTLTLFITGLTLTSCDDKLDVLQAYDFTVATMPVQKSIQEGETAEIRCQINKSGHYDQSEFHIGYFQPDGEGTLKLDNGTVFKPNDKYPLSDETFRLYYTSECDEQQQIDIIIYDNFDQKREMTFLFQNDNK